MSYLGSLVSGFDLKQEFVVVNGLILGIMVLGVFLSFRVLNIADLSVEGVIPMMTMLTAVMIGADINPWLALLISMALGAICGVINALLTIYLKTPPLLSGIIVMALTFGIAIMINAMKAGQASFNPNDHLTCFNWLRKLLAGDSTDRNWLFFASYLSYILVAALVLAALFAVLYFFFGTELGITSHYLALHHHLVRVRPPLPALKYPVNACIWRFAGRFLLCGGIVLEWILERGNG